MTSFINPIEQQSEAVAKMAEDWPIISSLMGGTKAMRASGTRFLPRWPAEDQESYKTRLAVSTLHNVFKRTVKILASKPFSEELTVSEDVPGKIKPWLENIDLQGRSLHVFASTLMIELMAYGFCGVLVDFQKRDPEIKTIADEKAAGLRPYFVHYSPWNILGWRTEIVNGAVKLTQLRLREWAILPDGEYGEKKVERIRVLVPGAWELFEKSEKGEWLSIDMNITTLNEIPFVPFYGERTGFMTAEPLLIDLAYQNIEHYQSSSDQQNILHVARVPLLTIIGANDKTEVNSGASTFVSLPLQADMKFVEHSGAAIGAGRQSLLDLEERMRQTGAELLLLKPGNVTATEVNSDDEGNKCDLQRITETTEDALDQCLQFMAMWIGEKDGGNVTLFKDFGASTLGESTAQLLLDMNLAGKLSDETLFEEQKRRGIISPDCKFDEEKERLENQGPPPGVVGVNIDKEDSAEAA